MARWSKLTNVLSAVKRPPRIRRPTSMRPSRPSVSVPPSSAMRRNPTKAFDTIKTARKFSKKRAGDLLEICTKNKSRAAACTGAGAAVGYVYMHHNTLSNAQQDCMAKCLPENWPMVEQFGDAPDFHASNDDPSRRPKCTAGIGRDKCEGYCKSACKEANPKNAFTGAQDLLTDAIDSAKDVVEDVLGIDFELIFYAGAAVVGLLVLLLVYKMYSWLNPTSSQSLVLRVAH